MINARIDSPATANDMPAAAKEEEQVRRPKLKKADFEEHGYTKDCPGCRWIQSGFAGNRNHPEACRRRMETALRNSVEGKKRVEEAEERFTRLNEKKLEREEAKGVDKDEDRRGNNEMYKRRKRGGKHAQQGRARTAQGSIASGSHNHPKSIKRTKKHTVGKSTQPPSRRRMPREDDASNFLTCLSKTRDTRSLEIVA